MEGRYYAPYKTGEAMNYYLGLDNGGSVSKAALYDVNGAELCVSSVKTSMIVPRDGYTERDMDELWEADCRVIKDVIEKSGVDPKDIKGVAFSGHGKGLYLWGKNDAPVRNGIISTDNRSLPQVFALKESGAEEEIFQLSGQHLIPCQPSMLLKWLQQNEPESLKNTRWVFSCKDYVRFRMTGKACMEKTETSGSTLVNIRTGNYDDRLFELLGLQEIRECMPPIVNSTDICGYVTEEAAQKCGLVAGTPVAGGMADIFSCGIAANQTDKRDVVMIAGTWSIQQLVRNAPIMDGSVLLNNFYALPGTFMLEESSPTSAGNFEWFMKNLFKEYADAFGGSAVYDDINAGVERVSPKEFCPIFLPFMLGSNVNPIAKGSLIGLNVSHTRSHLVRGVYEGIAFSHKMHFDNLRSIMDEPPRVIILEGGAARSKVWVQIFADTMQVPVRTIAATEAGTLGCAMAAAAAVGEYSDLEAASRAMCKIVDEVQPIAENLPVYEKKYAMYKACIEALDPVWKSIYEF